MSEENKKSCLGEDSIPDHVIQTTVAHEEVREKSYGVRRIEALNKQYDTWLGKITIFLSIFIVSYAYALDGTVRTTYQSYATSSYSQHSLVSTVSVVGLVTGCVAQLFYARLSDVFGRLELFLVSVGLYVVGTVIESQAYDVTRFAAGAVIYQIGYSGVLGLMQIIIADFSNLNWRVFCIFVTSLPVVINTWVSGDITESVLLSRSWSWGIGMWAFIFPLSCIPLVCCFIHMWYLASKNGDLQKITGVSEYERLGFKKFFVDVFFWKLDLVGLLAIMVSLGLILTPFTLAGGEEAEWRKAKILVPLIFGCCMMPFIALWEIKYARYPFITRELIRQKAVWGALIIAIFTEIVWYMQGSFLYTVLVVAFNESIKSATRITSLFYFVSAITGTILGLIIAYIRRLKAFIIFGIIMWIVAMGIMIKYRAGISSHDGIIGAQCLLGFGAGFFTSLTQCSIQTVTDHEGMATVLSLYLALYYVGAAIGGAISGAIWTQILPKEINLRFDNATIAASAYGSPLTWIYEYPWGTPERELLVASYKYVQKLLVVVGLCFCIPLLAFAFLLEDPELKSVQNLKDIEVNSEISEEETPKKKNSFAFFSRS